MQTSCSVVTAEAIQQTGNLVPPKQLVAAGHRTVLHTCRGRKTQDQIHRGQGRAPAPEHFTGLPLDGVTQHRRPGLFFRNDKTDPGDEGFPAFYSRPRLLTEMQREMFAAQYPARRENLGIVFGGQQPVFPAKTFLDGDVQTASR